MKRALAWLAGIAGVAALGRWLAQRTRRGPEVAPPIPEPPAAPDATAPDATPPDADDPAAELRRRLAESRRAETGESPAAGAPGDTAEPGETLDERRARIHAKARAAIDAMTEDGAR